LGFATLYPTYEKQPFSQSWILKGETQQIIAGKLTIKFSIYVQQMFDVEIAGDGDNIIFLSR